MAEQTEQPTKPNLIFYEVLTGNLPTGQEGLVQIFRQPDGRITLAQLAFRAQRWETWGIPTRLEHVSTTPAEKGGQ